MRLSKLVNIHLYLVEDDLLHETSHIKPDLQDLSQTNVVLIDEELAP